MLIGWLLPAPSSTPTSTDAASFSIALCDTETNSFGRVLKLLSDKSDLEHLEYVHLESKTSLLRNKK